MAGIFGGRNEKAVFVKKGEAPPLRATGPPGHREEEEHQESESRNQKAESREQSRRKQVRNGADRYICFLLEIISIVRYRPNQISNQK